MGRGLDCSRFAWQTRREPAPTGERLRSGRLARSVFCRNHSPAANQLAFALQGRDLRERWCAARRTYSGTRTNNTEQRAFQATLIETLPST